ncbi:MAG: nucleoside deaminase, partial [Bifidobacteriaceae bacterium]|nr:nucleoside deaminase [Bifidobacteriaceae bacterium]
MHGPNLPPASASGAQPMTPNPPTPSESGACGRGTASSGGGAVGEEVGEWMRLALVEARAALDSGDVPVGAVVVDKLGEVIGAGRNRREDDADPSAHAEVLALREAAKRVGTWRLEGCTLVSTLEPCPMCAGAAVAARVQRVVFGAWDPKAGAAGSVWDLLRDRRLNHRPEVLPG